MSDGDWWSRLRGIFARSRGGATARTGTIDQLRTELDQAFSHQMTQLARMRRSVADVSMSRRRLELQLNQAHADIADLDEQARAAVATGNDARARELLIQQLAVESRAEDLGQRHQNLADEEAKLHAQVDTVERRVEDFRIRKDTLAARYEAARARGELHAATSAYSASSAELNAAMDEARRQTAALEATAEGYEELIDEGIIAAGGETSDEALARRFDELLSEHDAGGGDDGSHPISS